MSNEYMSNEYISFEEFKFAYTDGFLNNFKDIEQSEALKKFLEKIKEVNTLIFNQPKNEEALKITLEVFNDLIKEAIESDWKIRFYTNNPPNKFRLDFFLGSMFPNKIVQTNNLHIRNNKFPFLGKEVFLQEIVVGNPLCNYFKIGRIVSEKDDIALESNAIFEAKLIKQHGGIDYYNLGKEDVGAEPNFSDVKFKDFFSKMFKSFILENSKEMAELFSVLFKNIDEDDVFVKLKEEFEEGNYYRFSDTCGVIKLMKETAIEFIKNDIRKNPTDKKFYWLKNKVNKVDRVNLEELSVNSFIEDLFSMGEHCLIIDLSYEKKIERINQNIMLLNKLYDLKKVDKVFLKGICEKFERGIYKDDTYEKMVLQNFCDKYELKELINSSLMKYECMNKYTYARFKKETGGLSIDKILNVRYLREEYDEKIYEIDSEVFTLIMNNIKIQNDDFKTSDKYLESICKSFNHLGFDIRLGYLKSKLNKIYVSKDIDVDIKEIVPMVVKVAEHLINKDDLSAVAEYKEMLLAKKFEESNKNKGLLSVQRKKI